MLGLETPSSDIIVLSQPATYHANQALGVCHRDVHPSPWPLGPPASMGSGGHRSLMLGLVREGPQTWKPNRSLTGWRGCSMASGDTSGF